MNRKKTLTFDLFWKDINIVLQEALTTSEGGSIKGKAIAYANQLHLQNDNYQELRQHPIQTLIGIIIQKIKNGQGTTCFSVSYRE